MVTRAEEIYESLNTFEEPWPICVPSYSRPDNPVLRSLKKWPDLNVVLFIRKKQQALYSDWKCPKVLLHSVRNIGETRAAVVKYANYKGWKNIFMCDDDITALDVLVNTVNSSGQPAMRGYRNEKKENRERGLDPKIFAVWQKRVQELDKTVTISGARYRPFSWHPAKPFLYNKGECIQLVHLNIEKLYDFGVNYRSNETVGAEDYDLQFQIMSSGGFSAVLSDIMYDTPAIGSVSGGCNASEPIKDLRKRYEEYCKRFTENVSGENHPGIRVTRTRTGIPSIKFNWGYWQCV